MADQLMTAASELAVAIPEVWSQTFYDTLLERLPMNALVSRDYEGEIQALGDTVNVTTIPQFSVAESIGETQKADAEAVTLTQTQLVVNKIYAKDFILTMQGRRQAIDVIPELEEMALYAIAKKLQQDILSETVASASAPDHQIGYDSGTTLALADILEAKELLDDQNVPMSDRHMILDSAQYNDLLNVTNFVSRDYVPNSEAMSSGAISTPVLGFMVDYTTEVSDVSYFFHRSYFHAAVQSAPSVEVVPLGQDGSRGLRFNTTMLLGTKQFDDERVVEMS